MRKIGFKRFNWDDHRKSWILYFHSPKSDTEIFILEKDIKNVAIVVEEESQQKCFVFVCESDYAGITTYLCPYLKEIEDDLLLFGWDCSNYSL